MSAAEPLALPEPDTTSLLADCSALRSHAQPAAAAAAPLAQLDAALQLHLLREAGLFGQGVAVAIVDDGVYRASLEARLFETGLLETGLLETGLLATGLLESPAPTLDARHSRTSGLREPFSRVRRTHGSMCAFDACIAAPRITLLDFPVHAPRPVGKRRLFDVLAAYHRILHLLAARVFRHVVVVNAWQALPGDVLAGVRPDAPEHPLHRALCLLDAAGADVLFAAPDHHAERLHGPALHARVLTVAAVNLDGTPFDSAVERLGPEGSGKPELANYQGFHGYQLFRGQGDYGTSAATALTAGIVAALRSSPALRDKSPCELRELLARSARQKFAWAEPAGVAPGIVDVAYVLSHLS